MICSALLQVLLARLIATGDSRPPLPPYRREGTVVVADDPSPHTYQVVGDRFVCTVKDECRCYSLPSLKVLWSARVSGMEYAGQVTADGAHAVVVGGVKADRAMLGCISMSSGRMEWTMPAGEAGSTIGLHGKTLYASLKPATISAVDMATRRTLWTTTLKLGKDYVRGSSIESVAASDDCVAVGTESTVAGLDPRSGAVRWIKSGAAFDPAPLAQPGAVWYMAGSGPARVDSRTGKSLVECVGGEFAEFFSVSGRHVASASAAVVKGFDGVTGEVLWSHKIGDSSSFTVGGPTSAEIGGALFARGTSEGIVVGPSGAVLWTGGKAVDLPLPVWTDGRWMVSYDDGRLTRYVHGKEEGVPPDSARRRALAEKMVRQFDKLDDNDKRRLASLGNDAFDPLLRTYMAACAQKSRDDDTGRYSREQSLSNLMVQVASAKCIPAVMKALDPPNSPEDARETLLEILGKHGTDGQATPYLIRELSHLDNNSFNNFLEAPTVALERLCASRDPRGVAFLLRALADPQANEEVRYQAYTHLAGTGGEAGLRAVLAARNRVATLRPLADRAAEALNANDRQSKQLGKTIDAQGREWGLFTLGILGSHGDLWIAERVGGRWANPLFSGVSTLGVSRWVKPPMPDPTFEGKTAKQLAAGAWKTVLIGNPALAKDSSGGGLTDIERRRLSVDPSRPDANVTGTALWANAPSRPLSEAEQVLAAAFEARYHDREDEAPAVFSAPKDMKPFAMPGRKNVTVWTVESANRNDAWKTPLEQCYEQGVCLISFSAYRGLVNPRTREPIEPKGPWEDRLIEWGPKHQTATVLISTYYGGLDGTGYSVRLRKFGSEWVVVGTHMEWIS